MSTQSADLHRSLLRPTIIYTLRAIGFHSTKPSVLDALVNLAERHLMLLASTTAQCARSSHNDSIPTVADLRQALTECSVLVPYADATEEELREVLRRPIDDYLTMPGGQVRAMAELKRREEQDTRDVRDFLTWFDGPQYAEIKRIAGSQDNGSGPGVGVGGGMLQAEDFLTILKKRRGKGTHEIDSVLGQGVQEARAVTIEGGAVRSLRHWAPQVLKADQP